MEKLKKLNNENILTFLLLLVILWFCYEFFKYLNDPNAISNDDSAATKLSKENLELIGIIQSNDRLSDKLCPELVKLD